MQNQDKFQIINPVVHPSVGSGSGIDIFQLFLTNFISIALGAAGVVCFFMLLTGGIQWITAGGDKEATQNAQKRITNALIGLVIVFSLFAIIYLIESVFGVSILKLTIPVI